MDWLDWLPDCEWNSRKFMLCIWNILNGKKTSPFQYYINNYKKRQAPNEDIQEGFWRMKKKKTTPLFTRQFDLELHCQNVFVIMGQMWHDSQMTQLNTGMGTADFNYSEANFHNSGGRNENRYQLTNWLADWLTAWLWNIKRDDPFKGFVLYGISSSSSSSWTTGYWLIPPLLTLWPCKTWTWTNAINNISVVSFISFSVLQSFHLEHFLVIICFCYGKSDGIQFGGYGKIVGTPYTISRKNILYDFWATSKDGLKLCGVQYLVPYLIMQNMSKSETIYTKFRAIPISKFHDGQMKNTSSVRLRHQIGT